MFSGLKKEVTLSEIYKNPADSIDAAKYLGIDLKKMPSHVAFIMDGNGRWAVNKGKKRTFGHRNGVKVVKDLVKAFRFLGIKNMTIYAFSTENWNRTKEEVGFLMNLFEESILKECKELKESGVRVKFIGRISELRENLREKIKWIEEETKEQTGLTLNIAANYGGRSEIIDVVKSIVTEVEKGNLKKEDIDETLFEKYLYTSGLPDPDLIIRTSGEMRISNYLLWQIAYSEIWVTETCWPDFSIPEFLRAIYEFQNRDRKFGKVK